MLDFYWLLTYIYVCLTRESACVNVKEFNGIFHVVDNWFNNVWALIRWNGSFQIEVCHERSRIMGFVTSALHVYYINGGRVEKSQT